MIEHVWRRLRLCDILDDIIIATCDREIAHEVGRFGGKFVMTSDRHESCLDRVAEAAEGLNADIIINVQGDAPLIHPASLKELVLPLLEEKNVLFADMMGMIDEVAEVDDANVVKVVVDHEQFALYYSREPIPSKKKTKNDKLTKRYKQFGINAFHKESLIKFTSLERTTLEKIESVDMLRLLENGYKVRMVLSAHKFKGVDTPEDLVEVAQLLQDDPIASCYMKT